MVKDLKNIIKENRLLIPLREAAGMLSMTRQTLMEHVKRGELACVRMAMNSVFFRPSDLHKFIDTKIVEYNPKKIPLYKDLT